MARWKGVVGDALRFHTDAAQATELAIGGAILNRMLDVGHPDSVRAACSPAGLGRSLALVTSCDKPTCHLSVF